MENLKLLHQKVHGQVYRAIQKGQLKRGSCVICGWRRVHGHHSDYSKPLSVVWICPTHHRMVTDGRLCLLSEKPMSKNGDGRQDQSSPKHPVMIYIPVELHEYLRLRAYESGLSKSAFMICLLRREKSVRNSPSDSTA
jgi:hypothetical protein